MKINIRNSFRCVVESRLAFVTDMDAPCENKTQHSSGVRWWNRPTREWAESVASLFNNKIPASPLHSAQQCRPFLGGCGSAFTSSVVGRCCAESHRWDFGGGIEAVGGAWVDEWTIVWKMTPALAGSCSVGSFFGRCCYYDIKWMMMMMYGCEKMDEVYRSHLSAGNGRSNGNGKCLGRQLFFPQQSAAVSSFVFVTW